MEIEYGRTVSPCMGIHVYNSGQKVVQAGEHIAFGMINK